MKAKETSKLISILLAMAVAFTMLIMDCGVANAATNTTTDGKYEYSIKEGAVTIDKYLGDEKNVVIPETIEGLPVTKIGAYAFSQNGTMESVTGNSIESIVGGAFYSCSTLKEVQFPNVVKLLSYNDGGSSNYGHGQFIGVFEGCGKLSEIVFPKVEKISEFALVGVALDKLYCPSLNRLEVATFASNASIVYGSSSWHFTMGSLIENIFFPCTLEVSWSFVQYNYWDCAGYKSFKRIHNDRINWEIISAATCTTDGEQQGTCTDCNEVVTEVIPATGHTLGDWAVTKAATCTTTGTKERICSICKEESTKETEVIPIDTTAHSFTNYVYNNDAKVGVDGTETASCENGCGEKDTRTKAGTALSSGGSSGGGFILPAQPEKPTIPMGEGYTVTLGSDGKTATITVEDGYELVGVTVNGESKGIATSLSNLKTGDKVEVKVSKKVEITEIEKVKAELKKVNADNFKARSKQVKLKNGKKAVKITWINTSGVEFDCIEVFRSTKRYKGYGKKPIFTTKTGKYYNTSIKKGTKYYYRVRGYIEVDGVKYYSGYSKKAWRTVK